jgi:type I restriction enzyme S subunit
MGSIMAGLNMAIIKELPVWLPNIPTQAEIIERFDTLSATVCSAEAVYQRKNAALAELKQSLLAKAFAGELT